jgi:membrane protein required for colicin V production
LNFLDIIIVIIFLIGFILGFKDGLVRKIIGLVGLVVGAFLAFNFASDVGKMIEGFFSIEFYLSELIAAVIIFLVIILIFSFIKRVVHPYDKVNNLINQILGGIIGAAQILFFLSAVFFLLEIFDVPDKNTSRSSLLYKPVYSIIPVSIDYLNNFAPDSKKILKKYIKEKDSV